MSTSLTHILNDVCPVPWPPATALMLDYPLIPQNSETAAQTINRVYIEALWLPESIMSLSHFVIEVRRAAKQLPSHSNSQSSAFHDILRPLLLPLREIERKYQERLPNLLHDPQAAMEREGIEAEETAMWYAWHHGRPPVRHFPDPDNVDEEKWKRQWMLDTERREVVVQILLHLLFLSASSTSTSRIPLLPSRPRKRKRDVPHESIKKKRKSRKGGRSPSPLPFSPFENLEVLVDRLALWQAIEDDSEKFLNRHGDDGRDWMRVFWEDQVDPMFRDQLPDLVKQYGDKLTPPVIQGSSSEEEETVKSGPKPRKSRTKPNKKPTLTEADLIEPKAETKKAKNDPRSRSVSIEPSDRRSRSRSVSISAEEIKAIGGKRGGIAGNSRLFASEVDMRRQASSSAAMTRVLSGTSQLSLGNERVPVPPIQSSLGASSKAPITLVTETPPKSGQDDPWAGFDSDDDVVPGSSGLTFFQTTPPNGDSVAETPIKPKKVGK
ncbi:hypothetical protein FRC17_010742 [Serendipita sp. 399]|nr:hypothetical protein FRC17_010742 [Serendipita sp. 399]